MNLYILIACLLGGFAVGGVSSWRVQEWRHDAQRLEEAKEAAQMRSKRDAVTDRVADKTEKAKTKFEILTVKQIEQVPTYVSANDCPLSPGFRVLHDAAAAGVLPDAFGIADAEPVPAPAIANTIAENYGACLKNAQNLMGLQEWAREQLKLNSK